MAKAAVIKTHPLRFGGKKSAATPRRGSVSDTNTRRMSMATWTPRYMRSYR